MSSHLNYMVLTALDDPFWPSMRILIAGLVGISLGLVGALAGGARLAGRSAGGSHVLAGRDARLSAAETQNAYAGAGDSGVGTKP